MRAWPFLVPFFILLISCSETGETTEKEAVKLPGKEEKTITVEGLDVGDPGLEVTLFASEPMISNPTNMDVDHKGRVWMCQAYNYRNDFNSIPYQKKGDQILILEDTDGDGKADRSKVYYQGEDVNAALGICVMGNKVIVSCSPNVLVFTDTNGDDIPDKKEILLKSVGGLQHDHGLHAFVFGPDGKLYFNFGNAGEGLLSKDGVPLRDIDNLPVTAEGKPYREGMVFRMNPDGTGLEVLGWNFRNNYELALDSFGRIWQSDNDDDGNRGNRINFMMEYGNYGYKDEMTGADWRVKRTNMEDSVYRQHWHLNDPGVVPNLLQTYAGSPTGMLIYEGNLLPQKYRGSLILGDAGTNKVTAYPIAPEGAGFSVSGLTLLDGSKKDQWFRPSDVTVAPDGSLFVADWYDGGVGGHGIGDLKKGRIYRVAPKNSKPEVPRYNYKTVQGAAEALLNPNLDVRYQAWQALSGFGAKAETTLLGIFEKEETAHRARALWLLGRINGREQHYIGLGSRDHAPEIRMTAVKMAREAEKFDAAFFERMATDDSREVRREVALGIRHKKQTATWVKLATAYKGKDRWFLEALGIAADMNWDACLAALKEKEGASWLKNEAVRDIVWRSRGAATPGLLGEIISQVNEDQRARYYRAFDFQAGGTKNAVLVELLKKAVSVDEKVIIFRHFETPSITQDEEFNRILPSVLASIQNPADFLDIISRYEIRSQRGRLTKILFESKNPQITESAAGITIFLYGVSALKNAVNDPKADRKEVTTLIEKLGLVDNETVTKELIQIFMSEKYPMAYRRAAISAMRGWGSEQKLWTLFRVNKVPVELDKEAREILSGSMRSDIRTESLKMFGNNQPEIPQPDQQQMALKPGDKAKGKEVFEAYCQACHKVNKEGVDFGPGLSQIGRKLTREGLLIAILKPSQGISFGYEGSIITLNDGSQMQGIVTSKTASEYMVKYVGRSEVQILRKADVKSVDPLKDSLMPAFGLKEAELTDLVEYLSSLR